MLGWRDACTRDVSEAKGKVGGKSGCGAERACIVLGAACPSGKAEVAEEGGGTRETDERRRGCWKDRTPGDISGTSNKSSSEALRSNSRSICE